MLNRFGIFLVLVALSTLSVFATTVQAYEFEFKDLGIAHKVANIEGKMVLIAFTSESCYYCKLFDKEVLANQQVQDFLRGNYIFVRVEPGNNKTTFLGKTYTNNELFGVFGVRGTPTFVFLKDKTQITQVPGYMPAEDFIKALRFIVKVVEENYKEIFEVYSKKKDDYKGKPTIVKVKQNDAQYVLKYDKNTKQVDSVPTILDINTVYVTTNVEIANKLKEMGVLRVLLVENK
ncbi:thioredoxin family protein [Fervidobacterium sp.]